MEGQIVRQAHEQAASEMQNNLRNMLHQMIELAPGRLFRDIEQFHKKFGLQPVEPESAHKLPNDLLAFRIKFLMEELIEYTRACGAHVKIYEDDDQMKTAVMVDNDAAFKPDEAFDGLIDLVYVALGTAFLHGFPFDAGWLRVHEANMSKVRASGADDERSTRKHSADIVKPEGWQKPVLSDLLNGGAQEHA
jgi:predicted HAD superfamily Cof-like phosphohydrolase